MFKCEGPRRLIQGNCRIYSGNAVSFVIPALSCLNQGQGRTGSRTGEWVGAACGLRPEFSISVSFDRLSGLNLADSESSVRTQPASVRIYSAFRKDSIVPYVRSIASWNSSCGFFVRLSLLAESRQVLKILPVFFGGCAHVFSNSGDCQIVAIASGCIGKANGASGFGDDFRD